MRRRPGAHPFRRIHPPLPVRTRPLMAARHLPTGVAWVRQDHRHRTHVPPSDTLVSPTPGGGGHATVLHVAVAHLDAQVSGGRPHAVFTSISRFSPPRLRSSRIGELR